jgi:hypothetical protein
MKTLTKIIVCVIITILIISTVFYEIAENRSTHYVTPTRYPLAYQIIEVDNAGPYHNVTVYNTITTNTYPFTLSIGVTFGDENDTYLYIMNEDIKSGATTELGNFSKENIQNGFGVYGIIPDSTPPPTVTYTLVDYTLTTEVTFETLNARTTRAAISATICNKNGELLSTNPDATIKCYIVLNNGTTIQIQSTFDTLLNNNGITYEKNGLSGIQIQPTISKISYNQLTGPFYSYWIWSSDTPEYTTLNAYTFLTESGSNIVVPTPINAYINITSYSK